MVQPQSARAARPLDAPPSVRTQAPAALQLPLDHYRTEGTETRLVSFSFRLPTPPGRAAVGLDVLLGAAFGAQLARYGGQAEIAFTVARVTAQGRPQWTRALRIATPPGRTFREVLEQAGRSLRNPSPDLRVPDGGNRAKITWIEAGRGADLDVVAVLERSAEDLEGTDLHLVVGKARHGLRAAFVYDASLFERRTIERFAGHLRVLLAGAVADLDRAIAALPLLAPDEKRWLDSVCVGRIRPVLAERVHRSVEQHAAETPSAVALRHRDQSLDYRTLNGRANQLARHLQARGAGPGAHVVVCLEPSLDIAVALLAILKAGAVYVPLDPTYPAARIAAILDDTRPTLVISRSDLIPQLGLERHPTLALDTAGSLVDDQIDLDLDLPIEPDRPATIFYTSGTTGRPKGVVATHANVSAYVQSAIDRYGFTASDEMPAIARFSFSISMLELMMPLVAGGTLRVLDRDHVVDPARLAKTLGEVTFFHAGPSLLKGVIAFIRRQGTDFSSWDRVRHASSGGDMVPPEVLEGLKAIFSRAEVFVIYGCSEISCMGTTWPVPRGCDVSRTYVGRPFENVTVRVLDAARAPVPAGVVGEIHFAGDGVTRGYLDRDELTADKFVELDGQRFYRTGDLGRVSEDGWLEILGRSDFQVKVRGMRVELAEIEHHLRRAPGVRDGVVAARETEGGEKVLVAYVVPEEAHESEWAGRVAGIRRHISERLPDYMVPATYVELASLPLNHNMKVDRNALPAPEAADRRRAVGSRVRAPETPTEKKLAELWQKLLGVEAVGLDDNFFELGGHSILAVELVLDVESEIGVELEGMTVLRESLEVQASICEQRLATGVPTSRERPQRAPAAVTSEVFHFGRGGDLYGVLHQAASGAATREAVLICSPVGQEHVRADFVLQKLARSLAVKGVPVMRFDWFGCRDSLGDSVDATCTRWQGDIGEAVAELRRRTGATKITAVGVRLGATLLWNAARDLDLSRVVLWDAVESGAAHHAAMSDLHRAYLRSVRHLRLWRRSPPLGGAEQLVGTTWSTAALRELRSLAIRGDRPRAGLPVKRLDSDCRWEDLAVLEDVLPDVGIAARLAALVGEP